MKKTHSLILSIAMLFAVFLTASCERVTAAELAFDKGKPAVVETAASADRFVEADVREDIAVNENVRIRAVSASPASLKLQRPAFGRSASIDRAAERPREPDPENNYQRFRGLATDHFARADI